jgi:preprotein translocase subunit SecF
MNFFKTMKITALISSLLLILSVYYVLKTDLKYGLEFSGGTELVIGFKGDLDLESFRKRLSSLDIGKTTVQSYDKEDYIIKIPVNDLESLDNNEIKNSISSLLDKYYSGISPSIKQIDYIGPKVGQELVNNGLLAILYGSFAILIYVFIRFNIGFAFAAISALFHDFILALFFIAFLEIEVTLSTIAAILTVIGYSVNDTIVIFDRVRENLIIVKGSASEIINTSIKQTLSRTILTVVTVLIVLLPLFFYGGPQIEDFALIMIIGVAIGTYSSIFFAPYIMFLISKRKLTKNVE